MVCLGLVVTGALSMGGRVVGGPTNTSILPTQPLSLLECLNLAVDQNRTLCEARHDLEASRGIVMQTRAILIPHVRMSDSYQRFGASTFGSTVTTLPIPEQLWYGSVRVVQSVYEGGRMVSAYRSAKWTTRRALDQYQATLAEVLRDVRLAYYGVLLARSQQSVVEESLQRLEKQEAEVKRKFEAGASLRLELLQAEVELARLRPRLLAAKNQLRLGKTKLVDLLGFRLSGGSSQEVPLELSDTLEMRPVEIDLGLAIQEALTRRPELSVLGYTAKLNEEDVRKAKGASLPSLQVFTGYGGMNDPVDRNLYGWFAGAQLTWEMFDGLETRGKMRQAAATLERSHVAIENLKQQVEIQVRTAHSNLAEARETIASFKEAQAQADEALRLTRLRFDSGTATQLEVLGAQVAFTEMQAAALEALYHYNVAQAQLEFATGSILPAR